MVAEPEGDGAVAGLDLPGFGVPEGVEEVNLVVPRLHVRTGDEQGVAHPSAAAWGEHADHHNQAGLRREPAHGGRPRPVERLRGFDPGPGEGAHRGFWQHEEVSRVGGSGGDSAGDQVEVCGHVGAGGDLAEGDPHGASLPPRRTRRSSATGARAASRRPIAACESL